MSRKDYELMAGVFNAYISDDMDMVNDDQKTMARAIARAMAAELKTDNPRFNGDKFLEACGV